MEQTVDRVNKDITGNYVCICCVIVVSDPHNYSEYLCFNCTSLQNSLIIGSKK